MQICVVGIGNTWASDDAVGPLVVRQLESRYAAANLGQHKLIFVTVSEPAAALLDLKDSCNVLIIVDAVKSEAKPGTIHRQVWQPGLLQSRGVERASSHGLGVREVLDLADRLNRMPKQVFLWGIEVESTEPGQRLSPEVVDVFENLVNSLQQFIGDLSDGYRDNS